MQKFNYPESPVKTVKEKVHDYENVDHFRWLEGDNEGNLTPEVEEWTDKQNSFTRSVLDNLPGRNELEQRIKPLLELEKFFLVTISRKYIYYGRQKGNQNQPVFYYCPKDESLENEKVLIDSNKIDNSGLTAIAWLSPSHDGNLVAFGSYKGGDENYCLNIIDIENNKTLEDKISGKVAGVFWLPDNSGFIYSRLADEKNPYSRQICFHKLGQPQEKDDIIFEQYKEGPLATTYGPFASLSDDGKWLILGYFTSTRENDLWIADFSAWQKTGKLELKIIAHGLSAAFDAQINDDQLYIFTNYKAPNGRIITADLQNPAISNGKDIVKENPQAVIEDWSFSKNSLLVNYQKNACSLIKKFDKKGNYLKDIELPGIGTATILTNKNDSVYFITYTSFNQPDKIYSAKDTNDAKLSFYEIPIPYDLSQIVTEQKWFTSEDGTKVSMFLVHKKDLELNSNNPTLIFGYGGFAINMTPSFKPLLCPWLEDGGVYVLVNLRGGNEYGDSWHRQGMLENKTKVFEDLEACAENLISSKITSKDKLAVWGRSNGGLLAGAALTRRPDLFKVVVCGVPLLDMIRYHKFLMARFWIPEYGTAEDKDQFKTLIEYSPYQNIKEGQETPATFIYSGENDTRVHPLHARKMTAALQTFSGFSETRPILLWVDRDSGHGQGKPHNIALLEETDKWLFIRWQMGML
ncbi:MAG: prolyl oligopeptidase family serine peptidase [Candidatus Rifleibacteriota bacterium]